MCLCLWNHWPKNVAEKWRKALFNLPQNNFPTELPKYRNLNFGRSKPSLKTFLENGYKTKCHKLALEYLTHRFDWWIISNVTAISTNIFPEKSGIGTTRGFSKICWTCTIQQVEVKNIATFLTKVSWLKSAKDRRKIQISEVNKMSQKCARVSLTLYQKESESNWQEDIGPSLTSSERTKAYKKLTLSPKQATSTYLKNQIKSP